MALWAAYVCAYLRLSGRLVLPIGTVQFGHPLSLWVAVLIGVVTAVLLGLMADVGVFYWLRRAPVLAQVVASVGLMLLIQALIVVRFGGTGTQAPNVLPSGGFTLEGTVVSYGPLVLAGIVIVMAIAVFVYFTQTKRGIATRAGAENERTLTLTGYSPSRLAGLAWLVAAAVGGVAAILASPGAQPRPYDLCPHHCACSRRSSDRSAGSDRAARCLRACSRRAGDSTGIPHREDVVAVLGGERGRLRPSLHHHRGCLVPGRKAGADAGHGWPGEPTNRAGPTDPAAAGIRAGGSRGSPAPDAPVAPTVSRLSTRTSLYYWDCHWS